MTDDNVPKSINIDLTAAETLAISIALQALNKAHADQHGRSNPLVNVLMTKLAKIVDEQVISQMTNEQVTKGRAKVDQMMAGIENKKFIDEMNNGFNPDV